jgi:hypothetical protein
MTSTDSTVPGPLTLFADDVVFEYGPVEAQPPIASKAALQIAAHELRSAIFTSCNGYMARVE